MTTRSRNPFRTSACRLLAAGLMLLAVLAMAFVPAGFMPSVTPDGKIAIVICSGMDSKTVYVDADQAPAGETEDRAASQDACPYMLASASAAPMGDLILPLSFPARPEQFLTKADTPVLESATTLPPPARGPPSVMIL